MGDQRVVFFYYTSKIMIYLVACGSMFSLIDRSFLNQEFSSYLGSSFLKVSNSKISPRKSRSSAKGSDAYADHADTVGATSFIEIGGIRRTIFLVIDR